MNPTDESTPKKMARRPLTSRDTAWAKKLSQILVEKKVSPDLISVWSMMFGVGSGFCLAWAFVPQGIFSSVLLILAAVLIQLRLLCNLLDGMVAIEGGLSGPIGPVMNEVPDRLSDIAILCGMTLAIVHLPYALHVGALTTIFAVLTAYIRALAGSVGAPQRFIGWMGKSQRMALVTGVAVLAAFLPTYWAQIIWYVALVVLLLGCVQTCWVRSSALLNDMREGNKA